MKPQSFSSLAVTVTISMTLGACDWVDSAGGQAAPVGPVFDPAVATQVLLDDVPVGSVTVLNEQGSGSISAKRQGTSELLQTFTWSPEPAEQGNLPACADENGFRTEFAAQSLEQACPADSDCTLNFNPVEPATNPELAEFELLVPALNSPVGVRYNLNVEDSSGALEIREFTFCLISINEAPVAKDDRYKTIEDAVLEVEPGDNDLLNNDSDDTDTSNQELVVLTDPLEGPMHAAVFELRADGSFTYQTDLTNLSDDMEDSFTYQISDGVLAPSAATATIQIIAANSPPEVVEEIPELAGTEGEEFSYDFTDNFEDPEGGDLEFSFDEDEQLSSRTGLVLSPEGLLSGIPTSSDVRDYELILIVSDGSTEITETVVLEVEEAPVAVVNEPPEYVPFSARSQTTFLGIEMTDITPQFIDTDLLTYSMAGSRVLPLGVTLDRRTGVISGTPQEIGQFEDLQIKATDRDGQSVLSGEFYIYVTRRFGTR